MADKKEESAITPPILAKRDHYIAFGDVGDRNRGENPMSTIVYLKDPYFWVRDDERKNAEVLEHLQKENQV